MQNGGLFTFFEKGNPELGVKVLDGCGANGNYWVSVAAATNVGFTVEVTDVADGSVWRTTNPDGTYARAVVDTKGQPCD